MPKDYHSDPLSQQRPIHDCLLPPAKTDIFHNMKTLKRFVTPLCFLLLASCLKTSSPPEIPLETQVEMLTKGQVNDTISFAVKNCSGHKNPEAKVVRCLLNKSKAQRYLLDLEGAHKTLEEIDATQLKRPIKAEYLMEKTLVEFESGKSAKYLESFKRLKAETPKGSRLHNAVRITSIYLLADQMTPVKKLEVIKEVENNWKTILGPQHQSLFAWVHLSRARIYRRQQDWASANREIDLAMRLADVKTPDLGVDRVKILFEKLAIFHLNNQTEEKNQALKSTSNFLKAIQLPETYNEILALFQLNDEDFNKQVYQASFKKPPGPNHFLSEILDSIKKIRRQDDNE